MAMSSLVFTGSTPSETALAKNVFIALTVSPALGPVVESGGKYQRLSGLDWDALFNEENMPEMLQRRARDVAPMEKLNEHEILAPIGQQEVWAAGVTYFRSRDARIEEAKAGG